MPVGNAIFPSCVQLVSAQEALAALEAGAVSCLLTSEMNASIWDKQRPFLSRLWQMRKLRRDQPLVGHYRIIHSKFARQIPRGIVNLSDTCFLREQDHALLRQVDYYWMRELPIHPFLAVVNTSRRLQRYSAIARQGELVESLNQLRPISLGVSDLKLKAAVPTESKKYDIFFSGSLHSTPLRAELRKRLERMAREKTLNIFVPQETLPLNDYIQACAESYLVLSPSGWGWDCHRHYEAALAGSVPVSNYPNIRRYMPLEQDVHTLFHEPNADAMEQCLVSALSNRARLIEMGLKAREHVLAHHLQSNLLRQLIDTLLKKNVATTNGAQMSRE